MSTFHFKQFSVQNEKSAMKVNTDSVLLGSWVDIPKNAQTGLDIGSGTGLLALMIAQRHPKIQLTGIEIEPNAFEESKFNFENSPWYERLVSVKLPLQRFDVKTKFDFIISNPPYFVNDLKNQDDNKTQARHADSLSFEKLISFVESSLSDSGSFNVILPKIESEIFMQLADNHSLFLTKIAHIKPNSQKEVNRVMMCFEKTPKELLEEIFCVYQSQGRYSERHKELTRDFYLMN